ncbi:hypothetical protein GCM10010191_57260 [Actinomadura vinacea]|uniref:Uncharacterized protein n=1 Tax=Actinomadura vinacea TaxID=115336 RepID=A0ABN3JQL7_9ACTN
MSGALERRYELLLRCYPAAYRAEHGAEIVGTLLAAAEPGRRVPPLREAAALVREGLTARARRTVEGPVPWWADGLHLGVLVLAVVHLVHAFADIVLQGRSAWAWVAASVALVLALLRGKVWLALPLALAVALTVSRSMLFGPEATSSLGLNQATVHHSWVSLTPYWLMAAGTMALAARRSRDLRVRSWWWVAVPAATVGADALLGIELYSGLGSLGRAGLEGGLLLAGIWLTWATRSPRWALAAALYVLPGELSTLVNLSWTGGSTVVAAYWAVLAGLLLAMAATAVRGRAHGAGSGQER